MISVDLFLEGLVFPECPRWFTDRLWLSDMHAHNVLSVDLSGRTRVEATLPDKPAGLGRLKDGAPVVVGMRSRAIYRIAKEGGLLEYANLSGIPGRRANDLTVDSAGHVYVGELGWPAMSSAAGSGASGSLVLIDQEGGARQVAGDLDLPNGIVTTADSRTLIVAETDAMRLTQFDIDTEGSLHNRSIYAKLSGKPDGICLDEEGAVWVPTL